jgi:GWxTD domain-containing protein
MRRLGLGVLLSVAALGCAGSRASSAAGSDAARPSPSQDDSPVAGPGTAFYRRIGRLASGDPLPFVGTVAFAGGAGDTVLSILALSLENRSLRFEREPNGYTARYRVEIAIRPQSGAPLQLARDEVVRVATLQETTRADESILFQQNLKLLPGMQHVVVTLRDVASGVEGRAEGDYDAPRFGAETTSAPIITYQAKGRGERGDPLQLVLNPRGAIGFGGDTMLAYIEGYGFAGPHTVPFEVRGERDTLVYRDSLRFRGGRPVESQVVRLVPDSLALGELNLVVGSGAAARRVTALVSFTPAWLVTSYDQLLSLLRYYGPNPFLDSLRKADPADRGRLWREFWRASDPNTRTPENEQLDEYFARVASANAQIKDEGIPGWRTDRGEVFIVLGAPDDATENGQGSGRVIRWQYQTYRLTLFFVDESGFGRFRLTQQSRAEFDRLVARLRRGGRR